MSRRLYKSRSDRMIDGVCGGLAEYFDLDPTLVRIAWVILTLAGGSGILLYIIAMIVMPTNSASVSAPSTGKTSHSNQRFWGILLVALGIFWLAGNLGFSFWRHWWGFSWDLLLPILLVLAGVAFLFGGRNYISNVPASQPASTDPAGPAYPEATPNASGRKLYRSRTERKLFGVCGGLAMHFNIDPSIIRILFVLGVFASFGVALFVYFLMAIIVPDEPHTALAS